MSAAGLPKVHLVERRLRSQQLEPVAVGDADEELHRVQLAGTKNRSSVGFAAQKKPVPEETRSRPRFGLENVVWNGFLRIAEAYDRHRKTYLARDGIRVLSFVNDDVETNLAGVVAEIEAVLDR